MPFLSSLEGESAAGGRIALEAFRFFTAKFKMPFSRYAATVCSPAFTLVFWQHYLQKHTQSFTTPATRFALALLGKHGRGMAVHLGDFLSAKQDVRLQADLNSLAAFPEHLQHCLVTGPERRCQLHWLLYLHIHLFICGDSEALDWRAAARHPSSSTLLTPRLLPAARWSSYASAQRSSRSRRCCRRAAVPQTLHTPGYRCGQPCLFDYQYGC